MDMRRLQHNNQPGTTPHRQGHYEHKSHTTEKPRPPADLGSRTSRPIIEPPEHTWTSPLDLQEASWSGPEKRLVQGLQRTPGLQ